MTDLEAVRTQLPIPIYLAVIGYFVRRMTSGWRGPCPACGGGTRSTKFSVSADGLLANCFGCGLSGDVFALIQAIERVDFRAAVARALGLTVGAVEAFGQPGPEPVSSPSTSEPDAVRRRRTEAANERFWATLRLHSVPGEAYLHARGLGEMVHPETIRFNRFDAPTLPIRSLDDGRIVNVSQRRIDDGEPKTLFRPGHARGCYGDPTHLSETLGPVVVTEGWADYLSAVRVCEDNLVLGAPCASAVPVVVEALAVDLRDRGVLLVKHSDAAGDKATRAAILRAHERGVPLSNINVMSPHVGDLNDSFLEVLR